MRKRETLVRRPRSRGRRADPRERGLWGAVGSTATAKVVIMGLSGILGLVTSRLIIEHFGTAAYAQYGLLTTLPNLLPFADLGIAAVVINAVAGSPDPRHDVFARRTIVTAIRILIVSGSAIVAVAALITLLGWWRPLLGEGLIADGGSMAAFACMAIFGIVLPLTVGQRILVGLRRTNAQVASQGVVAPFMLLSVGAVVVLAVPAGTMLAVFSYIASGLVSVVCLWLAGRALGTQLRTAVREVPRLRTVPSVPVIALAWPMLVQMVALPVAMQTQRILISHLTRGDELAQYNLASQLFGVVLQTIAAAGLALWPLYAAARAESRVESPVATSLWFMAGGLLLAAALAAVSPWVVAFVTDGAFTLDGWLVLGFVVFVALQAAKYPTGMYMTDERGLRFQVVPVIVMVPLTLGLGWWLIGVLGAAGAVIASCIAVFVCQVIPNLWYVRRDLAARRTQQRPPGAAVGNERDADA
ncbi:lipopolysaccharide biosynthesis protein [Agromyces sp. NPDC058484]|uniref:lipopolysaccharide biosynthesis protein n=1 Tax=Agromyces sp. NPDC058484 TaxID=3346524 RepID=UPI00365E55BE